MENARGRRRRPIKSIDNMKRRNLSYKKRNECLKKKTMELSILCDIKACAICLGPNGEVDTWPESPSDVKAIIEMYREKEKHDGVKRKIQLFDALNGEVKKAEKKMIVPDLGEDWFKKLSMEASVDLVECLSFKIGALTKRIEFLKATKEKEIEKEKDNSGPINKSPEKIDDLGMVPDFCQTNFAFAPTNYFDQMVHDMPPLQDFDPANEFGYNQMMGFDAQSVPNECYGFVDGNSSNNDASAWQFDIPEMFPQPLPCSVVNASVAGDQFQFQFQFQFLADLLLDGNSGNNDASAWHFNIPELFPQPLPCSVVNASEADDQFQFLTDLLLDNEKFNLCF